MYRLLTPLAVVLGLTLSSPAAAKRTHMEPPLSSELVKPKKQKQSSKKLNKKPIRMVKVRPSTAFVRDCSFIDLTCRIRDGRPTAEQTARAFGAEKRKPNPTMTTRGHDVVMEAKKWEGKSAVRDRKELKALFNTGNNSPVDPDRIPWCAAFANAILSRSGYETTNSLMARSFLGWGRKTKEPKEGDVVVLRRGPDGWTGHVGFFYGYENIDGVRYVKVLGGNQKMAVNVSHYPIHRVLGYRTATVKYGDDNA